MTNLNQILISVPAILIALTIHEFSHGYVAHYLGDPTPKRQGRLTLNPLPHLDPLGTLLLLVAHFGWAKPVQVNPFYFRGDRQRGMLLVALAGPGSNLIVALLSGILYNLFVQSVILAMFFLTLLSINVYLAIFNLLPVPPLDGSKILAGLLPRRMHGYIHQLEIYGPFILLLLIFTNVIGKILVPVSQTIIIMIIEISQILVGRI